MKQQWLQYFTYLLWLFGILLSVGGIAYICVVITFMALDIHQLLSLFKPI